MKITAVWPKSCRQTDATNALKSTTIIKLYITENLAVYSRLIQEIVPRISVNLDKFD